MNDLIKRLRDLAEAYQSTGNGETKTCKYATEAADALERMQWTPMKGREDFYEVSPFGTIRKKTGERVGQWVNDQGYFLVKLTNPREDIRVHRAVAETFLNNPNNWPVVNHKDHDRGNNDYENLEWCTQKHNLNHARAAGRMPGDHWKGKRSPNAKLAHSTAEEIRRLYATGKWSQSELAGYFDTNKKTVYSIVNMKSYLLPLPEPPKQKNHPFLGGWLDLMPWERLCCIYD